MASIDYSYQNPSGFFFISHAKYSYCCLLSTGITKFEFEKETERFLGGCSRMKPS